MKEFSRQGRQISTSESISFFGGTQIVDYMDILMTKCFCTDDEGYSNYRVLKSALSAEKISKLVTYDEYETENNVRDALEESGNMVSFLMFDDSDGVHKVLFYHSDDKYFGYINNNGSVSVDQITYDSLEVVKFDKYRGGWDEYLMSLGVDVEDFYEWIEDLIKSDSEKVGTHNGE